MVRHVREVEQDLVALQKEGRTEELSLHESFGALFHDRSKFQKQIASSGKNVRFAQIINDEGALGF